MLDTNGFRVIPAPNAEAAIGAFKENMVALVLADATLPELDGKKLVERLKGIAAHIPMILLYDPKTITAGYIADAMLIKKIISSADLLERIKVMSARKRGPRKKIAEVRYVGVA